MRRGSTPVSTGPRSYLQVVTFLHVEVQPVLQLLQVPGLLQDALPLAKRLQATCFPAMRRHSPGLTRTPPSSLPGALFLGEGQENGLKSFSQQQRGPILLPLSLSGPPIPVMVILLNHTDAPGMEMDSEEV